MRIFLVGMCDIFLILYLTTLSQVNQHKTGHLTVDDYNKAREEETIAKDDAAKSKEDVSKLKKSILALENEKKRALLLADYAEAEAISIFKQLEQSEDERKKAKDLEAKALMSAKLKQENTQQANVFLAEAIRQKDKLMSQLEAAMKNKEDAKTISEKAELKAKEAKQKETEALKIALIAKKDAEFAKEKEIKAVELKIKSQAEAETARKNEEEALKLSRIAMKNETKALMLSEISKENEEMALLEAEKAKEEAQKAKEEMEKALTLAKKAAEEARIAKEKEAKALDLANKAQGETILANELKANAVQNQLIAQEKAANALSVASEAKRETAKTNLKIRTITQTADNAFDINIKDKIIHFKVEIKYGSRPGNTKTKTIQMQGVPVKIDNHLFLFTLADQIGLWKTLSPKKYFSYNITVNGQPISNLYVKPGTTKITALEINDEIEHSLPLGEIYDFSSYMPVLLAIRGQGDLGVTDKIRGVGDDFFVFKRDYLRMISMDEFYFGTEGIRGTGDYAEYILKGDQIIDLAGKFVGLAYKKNTIMRIYKLRGWHKIAMNNLSAPDLVTLVRALTRS